MSSEVTLLSDLKKKIHQEAERLVTNKFTYKILSLSHMIDTFSVRTSPFYTKFNENGSLDDRANKKRKISAGESSHDNNRPAFFDINQSLDKAIELARIELEDLASFAQTVRTNLLIVTHQVPGGQVQAHEDWISELTKASDTAHQLLELEDKYHKDRTAVHVAYATIHSSIRTPSTMMEYEHTLQSLERSAFRSCRQQIIDVRDIYFCLLDTYNKISFYPSPLLKSQVVVHVDFDIMHAGKRASTSTAKVTGSTSSGEVTRFTKSTRSSKYPFRLNFYDTPPIDEITLDEFEEWAIDRLRILTDIETCQARGLSGDQLRASLTAKSKEHLPMSSNTAKGMDTDRERRKDQYGHFVLRLAFARSEELRSRFVRAETTLFRFRFESDDSEERRQFIDSLKFDWAPVEQEEKYKYRSQLQTSSNIAESKFDAEAFFKVRWTRVADLVSSRRVFIAGGFAYVPMKEQLSLVITEFVARLTKSLDITAKALPRLDEDDRLVPVLDHLSTGFTGLLSTNYDATANANGEEITAEMIPDLSRNHFPMCMRMEQNTLNTDHHLKHHGRYQYNLFLKGIGMSVEEALLFWRKSFSLISDDKFTKDYKYNVRHNYGLEGSKVNYSPMSCQQIIMGKIPGDQESHGCPFRHFNETNLSSALRSSYSLTAVEVKDVLASVTTQHYHVACTKVFEYQHAKYGVQKNAGLGDGESVTHPNTYFTKSRAFVLEPKVEDAMEVDG